MSRIAGLEDWTEPGAFEVAPNVYRIPLPLPNDGLRAVNVYALADSGHVTLIDAGWALPESLERLASALRVLGAGLDDVRQVLVTHIHRDHYSQAVFLRRQFGARVMLGLDERHSLDATMSQARRPLAVQLDVLRAHGATGTADSIEALVSDGQVRAGLSWELPDGWVEEGQQFQVGTRMLRAISTPGHTRGHVVYVDEKASLLFSGDHVLPHITPSIGFEPAPTDRPLRRFLDSLRFMRVLPDMRLLPAHGPIAPSVHSRVEELLGHHAARLDDAFSIVASGVDCAESVAQQLPWTKRRSKFESLDPFNRMLAVLETIAHLDLLVDEGRVRTETLEYIRYRASSAPDEERSVRRLYGVGIVAWEGRSC